MIWEERPHPIFGEGGKEPASRTEKILGRTGIFPKKQWVSGVFSIIEPCEITFGMYELHPVNGDVARFATLEEAKKFAEIIV